MKSALVAFLLFCGMAICQKREYIYINQSMTWSDALSYCREKYTDLATINYEEEKQMIMNTVDSSNAENVWIGLNRTGPELDVWQWSDGKLANMFQWKSGQPDNYGNIENCVTVSLQGWNDIKCSSAYTFICYVRLVLVRESKTWEDALDYCRIHYISLATPISECHLALTKNATAQTQTVSVWTGLRFVDRQWLCVGKHSLVSLTSLPECPDPYSRCGAWNTAINNWENRHCYEKLNFLCY